MPAPMPPLFRTGQALARWAVLAATLPLALAVFAEVLPPSLLSEPASLLSEPPSLLSEPASPGAAAPVAVPTDTPAAVPTDTPAAVPTDTPVNAPTVAPASVPADAPVFIAFDPGAYKCELGRSVQVREITNDRTTVTLQWERKDYKLSAVTARTGALRFEDPASGLVWIVIPAKAMLLDSGKGRQLANECRL